MKNQTLGGMIAALRKEKGLTQLELAEKMGITDKAVSKWERDLSCPDVSSLPKLAEILEVSVDQLMQIKLNRPRDSKGKSVNDILQLVFKAVALAMGIAVLVLSVLRAIDIYSGFFMLGLGLASVGIVLLSCHSKEDS